eukprot:Rmarinus@m.8305
MPSDILSFLPACLLRILVEDVQREDDPSQLPDVYTFDKSRSESEHRRKSAVIEGKDEVLNPFPETSKVLGSRMRRKWPASTLVNAVVFFLDVSGFTALSERLNDGNPEGAEDIAHYLNTYFSQLVRIIGGSGGDIMKFAGDATIVLFHDDIETTNEKTLALRAVQCALEIQRSLNKLTLSADIMLSCKVGLGVGAVHILRVGEERFEYLPVGPPLEQAFDAEGKCQPGDIALSPQVHRLIQGAVEGQAQEDGFFLLTLSDYSSVRVRKQGIQVSNKDLYDALSGLGEDNEASTTTTAANGDGLSLSPKQVDVVLSFARRYIPAAALRHLDLWTEDFQGVWAGELRRLTVLFINLGIPADRLTLVGSDPQAMEDAQKALRVVQEALYFYEGSLNKFLMDDKGSTVVASFGIPPCAHEDDAARAIFAGMRIRTELLGIGLSASVGVTTGLAFCGVVGAQMRREYTVMGDVVNLSARLMQAVKTGKAISTRFPPSDPTHFCGGVLCDDNTKKAAVGLSFEPLAALTVKGKSKPVPIFLPHSTLRMELPLHRTAEYQLAALQSTGHDFFNPHRSLKATQDLYRCFGYKEGSSRESIASASCTQGAAAQIFIVGRDEALQTVMDCFERTGSTDLPEAILLEGEAGMGKTLLLRAAWERMRGQKPVLVGAGSPFSERKLYPWLMIFGQLFSVESFPDRESLQAAVLKRLEELEPLVGGETADAGKTVGGSDGDAESALDASPRLRDFHPLMNAVLPTFFKDNDATAHLSPLAKDSLTVCFLADIIRAYAKKRGKLVLIIEDAMWVHDELSWATLNNVAAPGAPVLIILCTRPSCASTSHFSTHPMLLPAAAAAAASRMASESQGTNDHDEHIRNTPWSLRFLSAFLQDLDTVGDIDAYTGSSPRQSKRRSGNASRPRRVHRLKMAGLPSADLFRIIVRLLGVQCVPELLVDDLVKLSGRNPHACQQYVEAFLASGASSVNGGICQLSNDFIERARRSVACGVAARITAQLDRLPSLYLLLLKVAAVIMGPFRASTLRAVTPPGTTLALTSEYEVDSHLRTLEGAGLLEVCGDGDLFGRTYVIADKGVAYVVYRMMLGTQRSRLHMKIGQFYEADLPDGTSDVMLALHWADAGVEDKAREVLEKLLARKSEIASLSTADKATLSELKRRVRPAIGRGWLQKSKFPPGTVALSSARLLGVHTPDTKKRFFELKPGCLYYYTKESAKEPLGVIPLQLCSLVVHRRGPGGNDVSKDGKKEIPCWLELRSPEKAYYLWGEDAAQTESWGKTISEDGAVSLINLNAQDSNPINRVLCARRPSMLAALLVRRGSTLNTLGAEDTVSMSFGRRQSKLSLALAAASNSSTSDDKPPEPKTIVKEGLLLKNKKPSRANSKLRFCYLEEGGLHYCMPISIAQDGPLSEGQLWHPKDQTRFEKGATLGVLALHVCSVHDCGTIEQSGSHDPDSLFTFGFEVRAPHRSMYFYAHSREEKGRWMSALRTAIRGYSSVSFGRYVDLSAVEKKDAEEKLRQSRVGELFSESEDESASATDDNNAAGGSAGSPLGEIASLRTSSGRVSPTHHMRAASDSLAAVRASEEAAGGVSPDASGAGGSMRSSRRLQRRSTSSWKRQGVNLHEEMLAIQEDNKKLRSDLLIAAEMWEESCDVLEQAAGLIAHAIRRVDQEPFRVSDTQLRPDDDEYNQLHEKAAAVADQNEYLLSRLKVLDHLLQVSVKNQAATRRASVLSSSVTQQPLSFLEEHPEEGEG